MSLLLVARFRNKWAIIGGILLATLLNHGLSSWGGIWLGENMDNWLSGRVADYVLAGSFALMALWVLIPDKEDDDDDNFAKYGAFIATTLLFFIAEVGDKTQIATVILAAEFQSFFWVTAGTTLGMLIANAPVVIWGQWLMDRLPLDLHVALRLSYSSVWRPIRFSVADSLSLHKAVVRRDFRRV